MVFVCSPEVLGSTTGTTGFWSTVGVTSVFLVSGTVVVTLFVVFGSVVVLTFVARVGFVLFDELLSEVFAETQPVRVKVKTKHIANFFVTKYHL